MSGIIRCRTLKCKPLSPRNLPKRDRFILAGFIWGDVGGCRERVAPRGALRLLSVPRETPCGQKMPNMSTVAIAVSYRLYEIIDINENMFIYVDTYRTASGRFDQFEGLYRPQRGRLGQFWLLLKRLQYSYLPFFAHRVRKGLPIGLQRRQFERRVRKNGGAGCPAPPFSGVIISLRPYLRRLVELRVVQVGVEAALGEQLVVRALLDDVAVADHQDHVGVADRGQAVRDDKARAAPH